MFLSMQAKARIIVFVLMMACAVADIPSVPVIDLTPWTIPRDQDSETLAVRREKLVAEIREACRTVGFFQVIHHRVQSSVVTETWEASRGFFSQPKREKLLYKTPNEAEYPYGFEETEQLAKGKELDGQVGDKAAAGVMDTKETFAIGPNNTDSGMPLRRWQPTPSVPNFRNALESYYAEMEHLAGILVEIFALALDQPADYFVDKMDRHLSALRLVHYYPLLESEMVRGDIVRAGAHTDYGALTILNSERAGLEVLLYDSKNRTATQWYPVPVVPGALIINLGDLMQRWTNDEWVSTLHRVVMPTTKAGAQQEERYSMAFFVNVNGDTMIEPLTIQQAKAKYPPITAKDHLMAKHLASMGESPQVSHEEL